MFHRWISGSIRREFQTFRFHSLLKKHPVDARRSEGKERQGREERRGEEEEVEEAGSIGRYRYANSA